MPNFRKRSEPLRLEKSMKPPITAWIAQSPRGARAPALLLLCLALAGCHSVPLGSLIADLSEAETAHVRATFGQPTTAPEANPSAVPIVDPSSVRQVSVQGKTPDTQQPKPAPNAEQPIDLATALRLAGVENPTIALAEEAVRARLAERMLARALLFPTLDVGMNYRLHHGNYLTARGVVTDINIQSFYGGFGADAKGSGTVAVPGLRLVGHLADALYAPQAAQQKVVQSRFDATATRNVVLLEVGVRYLALVEAQASLAAHRQSLQEFEEIERLTANFAEAKQGRESDAQRARSETLLLRAEAQRTSEDLGVAAAELARLLALDPAITLRGVDVVPPVLEVVDKNYSVQQLFDQALAYHPEIVARSADVAFQEIRWRQERMRPWLPVIAVGFSAGEFGGSGPDTKSRLGNFVPRTDFDVIAVWSLQNLGAGNRAIQNIARSELELAQIERARVIDRIHRDIVEAHTLTQTRRQEMELARRRVVTSQRAFAQDLTRARNLKALPIEVLSSARQLAAARQDLVRAMIGYSQTQLQLYAALGNPPGQ
jgi:outer membrane protein TolC